MKEALLQSRVFFLGEKGKVEVKIKIKVEVEVEDKDTEDKVQNSLPLAD